MRHQRYGLLIVSAALLAVLPLDAYAYLDPGTGSMILQAIIGGIAAGLVVVRAWWDKIKLGFARMTGRASRVDSRGSEDDEEQQR